MELDQLVPQLRKLSFRRFDEGGDFFFDFDRVFPAIDGSGLGEHIDAGG